MARVVVDYIIETDGSMQVLVPGGQGVTFEQIKGAVGATVEQLQGAVPEIELDGEIEQHLHDDDAGHVRTTVNA
jgi:hypothetical protein